MLDRILKISLQNRLVVLIIAAALTVVGLYIAREMKVDVFPDLTAPTVAVLTEAHGMETEEVEKLVTYQVETALNGAPGVRRLRSSSSAGISIVWIEFEWGTDIYRARQIVSERLPMIREQLPEKTGDPTMAPISSIMGEIMLIGVTSDSLSPMQVRTLADWVIRPQLKSLGGIANVIILGGELKQYQVLADPDNLRHFGVSLEELQLAVSEANAVASGGFFNEFGNQYIVRGNARVHELVQLEQSVVKVVNGQPVKIGDIASVQIGAADKIGDGSLNASPAVIMTVSKQPDINTLELSRRIDTALSQMEESLPNSVDINSHIFRQADFISASISNLQQTLLEGALFVAIILFIFLMNWRTTIISLLAIPISLLVSIIILHLLGYTINTMSLGGMAIAIGVLVDDAIIDVENVFKRLRQNASLPEAQRESALKVVRDASVEIRSSIIIATLIIIVSFIPLFFLGGMEGRLLTPLGIAFITSVLTSLIVAVTLTPVLCYYLLRKERLLRKQAMGTKVERTFRRIYDSVLTKSLQYAKPIIAGTIGLFILSVILFFQLGRNFLPAFNEGSVVISAVGPPGMSLEESNEMGKLIENEILSLPEFSVVTRRTGRAELDEHAQGVNSSEVDAPFTLSQGQTKEELFEKLREHLDVFPGMNITIGQPIAHRVDHMISGTRANIAIKIFGDDLNVLFQTGKAVQQLIEGIPGLVDVSVEQQIEVPQISINPKRTYLTSYGLTAKSLMDYINVALAGESVGQIYEGQRQFELIVRLKPEYRSGIEQIRKLFVDLPGGRKVPITELAEIKSVSSPNSISREDVQRKVVVSANVQGRDLRSVVNEIKEKVGQELNMPPGYRIEYGGQFESEARASRMLLITSIFAVLVIFFLLYYEFRDLTLAGIVLINLPFALIGGVFIIYFTSGIVSIASTIGFISLFGIATRNGILLVSRYQDLQKEGLKGMELIKEGALDRMNPIIMTALTTSLALIPLVLKGGEAGNEIQSPMALVILGGLLTATLLNLVVIPSVYRLTLKSGD